MDLLSLAKDLGLPLLGAVAGWVTTSYVVKSDVKHLKAKVHALQKGWKLELDNHKSDNDEKHDETRNLLEALKTELKEDLEELEENLQRWQRESNSFASDDELNRFIEEQQRQWQAIQRTLGQIEGALKHLR